MLHYIFSIWNKIYPKKIKFWYLTNIFKENGLKNLIYENKIDCTGYDGYKAIEGIIAMHISDSNNGGKIKLPLIDEHMNFNVPWA